MFSVAYLEK